MVPYATLPFKPSFPVEPFTIAVPDAAISRLKSLLRDTELPDTYETRQTDWRWGVTMEWMEAAKRRWESGFDWKALEKELNSFPQYRATVENRNGTKHDVHFMAMFSKRKDAIPIVFLHGFPGTFIEFLSIFKLLQDRFTPDTLPYHVIAPSLIGFGFSSKPPLDGDFGVHTAASVYNGLMEGLGFIGGYLGQAGDLGSYILRAMGKYDACKGMHLNMLWIARPPKVDSSLVSDVEKEGLKRAAHWEKDGSAYFTLQATRPSTLGIALSTNPVAVLAWVGEKQVMWSDRKPGIDDVLGTVSVFWFTDTIASSFWCYRQHTRPRDLEPPPGKLLKPFGYSYFPFEIQPTPKAWAETQGEMVHFSTHERGGHFAAAEKPSELLGDVEGFVEVVRFSLPLFGNVGLAYFGGRCGREDPSVAQADYEQSTTAIRTERQGAGKPSLPPESS